MQTLFNAMKAEAIPLGSKLIQQEAELDRKFAAHTMTPEDLKLTIAAIAVSQGELRETHLKYHLQTVPLLTAAQMHRYAQLRGYSANQTHHHN
jgi:hypothetical protein